VWQSQLTDRLCKTVLSLWHGVYCLSAIGHLESVHHADSVSIKLQMQHLQTILLSDLQPLHLSQPPLMCCAATIMLKVTLQERVTVLTVLLNVCECL
jgi:hypothetical protein